MLVVGLAFLQCWYLEWSFCKRLFLVFNNVLGFSIPDFCMNAYNPIRFMGEVWALECATTTDFSVYMYFGFHPPWFWENAYNRV